MYEVGQRVRDKELGIIGMVSDVYRGLCSTVVVVRTEDTEYEVCCCDGPPFEILPGREIVLHPHYDISPIGSFTFYMGLTHTDLTTFMTWVELASRDNEWARINREHFRVHVEQSKKYVEYDLVRAAKLIK